jgi:hypothetical protein
MATPAVSSVTPAVTPPSVENAGAPKPTSVVIGDAVDRAVVGTTNVLANNAPKSADQLGDDLDSLRRGTATALGVKSLVKLTDGEKAVKSGLVVVGTVVSARDAVNNGVKTAQDIADGNYGAAAGDGAKTVKSAAIATKGGIQTATTLKTAVTKYSGQATKALENTGERVGEALAENGGRLLEAGGEAALHATAESAGRAVLKGAARFVPYANIAIAAADTTMAVKTVSDWKAGKASTGKMVCSVITAAASDTAAAVESIPVVGQTVGAVVGTAAAVVASVSSFIGGFFK